MIDVTITGADDHVDPAELAALSKEFPRVEWAILVASVDRFGTPRYPSLEWIAKFRETRGIRRAMHVCGTASREFQLGQWDQGEAAFARCQINGWNRKRGALVGMPRDFELIIQCQSVDDLGDAILDAIVLDRASVLFDVSGGRGIRPSGDVIEAAVRTVQETKKRLSFSKTWNKPLRVGFAGGIDATNVEEVIRTLGPGDYWLDMESGVRTNDRLDLKKVRDVLQTVQYCNARIEAEKTDAR